MEIPKTGNWMERVFAIKNDRDFESIALEAYQFQYNNNNIYNSYNKVLNKSPRTVRQLTDIPFLPISFFKTHKVVSTSFVPELIFKSSGTTGAFTSTHFVKDAHVYKESFLKCFRHFYGDPTDYCIIGLLPSYLERVDSSLVYMVQYLIERSGHPNSGFYLSDFEKLAQTIQQQQTKKEKLLLIGVTFALLDFARAYPVKLENAIVMETGGMKGRKKEMIREELYRELKTAFGVPEIHSEYGMTELLSQGYSIDGHLSIPKWMKIYLRDETDPLTLQPPQLNSSGAINIIDLANLYSCCFLATDDMGRTGPDGSFEILGRLDNSDIRGCSQLVT
ncbi:MAG TPA: acyl transferase [Flavisolibacter sp.]|jgi:phenylacetate-coenzyme A ligase PaaK-like adenylate-forming protein|nr:acyl transferase [Flavisolibacter sp.]